MLNVSKQAYFFTIVALVTAIINMITSGIVFGWQGVLAFIILFIICIPILLLMIYNIDCLSTGSCENWAWILSILAMVYMVYMTIIEIYIVSLKEVKEVKDDTDKKK